MNDETKSLLFRVALATAFTCVAVKWMVDQLDPTREKKNKAKKQAKALMTKLRITSNVQFTDYELAIASNLVDPESIPISWRDIAGLNEVLQELRDTLILPIRNRKMFGGSQLLQPPKGVLLHGPPGCGKTMVAKATAKEAGMRFLNLDSSALTDKWYGESQKLATAVFSLAVKIQPCIIFIDEIDSLLRSRDTHDHEATAMVKALFMSMWDGLTTDSNCCVVVMGATNRPQDVDKAILRRMPASFYIGLPVKEQRLKVTEIILQYEQLASDVDLDKLARLTEGFSGSDLRELCRTAAVYRLRDSLKNDGDPVLEEITMDDFLQAFHKMRESKMHCGTLPLSRIDLD